MLLAGGFHGKGEPWRCQGLHPRAAPLLQVRKPQAYTKVWAQSWSPYGNHFRATGQSLADCVLTAWRAIFNPHII